MRKKREITQNQRKSLGQKLSHKISKKSERRIIDGLKAAKKQAKADLLNMFSMDLYVEEVQRQREGGG